MRAAKERIKEIKGGTPARSAMDSADWNTNPIIDST